MEQINNQFFQDQLKRRNIEREMYNREMQKQLNPPPPPQSQSGGGGNPMGIASKFIPEGAAATGAEAGYGTGGAAAAGGTAATSGGTVAGAGSGAITGTPMSAYQGYGALQGGGAAGGTGSSGIAAAGPWAALAAAIYLNESQARDKGRRSEDDLTYGVDALSGNVLFQDIEALNDKMFKEDSNIGHEIEGMTDIAQWDFSNGFDNLKEGMFSPIFDLF